MLFFKEFSESMANFEKGLEPQNLFEKIHFATLDWKTPVIGAILYAVIVTIWGQYNKAKALKAEEPRVKAKKTVSVTAGSETNRFCLFNCLVIAHNVFLTVFSAYCFICIVKILFESYLQDDFLNAVTSIYCDRSLKQYYAGVNYLVWLFYMSKYYELLDTFILLLKGKPSSFLQTYHHAGSILSLWTMCVSRIPGMWIFTFLNSFIHTLMYYYFTLTCLGYRPKWKRHLTTLQITQFLVGNVFGIAYLVIPNCHNWDSNFRENVLQHRVFGTYYASIVFTFLFNFFFVGGLILLFNDFARRTYGQKKAVAATEAEKTEKVEKKAKADKRDKAEKSEKSEVKSKVKTVSKAKKEVPASPTKKVTAARKTSPVQIATSIEIEPEATVVKKSAASKARSKSRARSNIRSKSKARVASPAKEAAAPVQRRSRRS